MKLLKKIILLFIAFVFILTASCKKYPDGPLLNIYSKASRIDGTWDVEYFSINGYDSTAYLKSVGFYGRYKFSNKKDGLELFAMYSAANIYTKVGYWKFQNKKKDLYIHFDVYSGLPNVSLGPYGANDVVWEIRRLKTHELWLKTVYEGREFYVKFKSKIA
jgi:hypothetical protein